MLTSRRARDRDPSSSRHDRPERSDAQPENLRVQYQETTGLAVLYGTTADLHRARGAEGDAEAVLRAGLARNPGAAALHHALGLSLVRSKRKPEGLRALRDAANLDPGNARFAYVYAVALNDSGRGKEALKVLDTALTQHPNDRGVLSALVHFSAQSGKRELSLGYLKKIKRTRP